MNEPVAPISARWRTARVRAIVGRTPRIKSFFFELAHPMTFLAGQHVDVRLIAPDGYRAMRSYSIASSPSASATIELAVERLNDGEVSTFFHDVVTVGDSIDLRGPLGGHFVWSPSDSRSILLIGGGSGAVPLISMVRERHAAGASAPMTLLYSARAWRDVLYPDELLGYAAAAGGVSLAFALTRDAPVRNLDFGRRIDAAMVAAVLARGTQAAELAYVCGTNAFVDAAADAAIAAGIPQAVIRTERYGA